MHYMNKNSRLCFYYNQKVSFEYTKEHWNPISQKACLGGKALGEKTAGLPPT